MEIYLKTGQLFAVPVSVADHLLKLASHDQLKVLLYVLCHADETLTQKQIADACKVRREAITEALQFWQDANVLFYSEQTPSVKIADLPQQAAPAQQPAAALPKAAEPEPAAPARVIPQHRHELTPSEIAALCAQDSAFQEMLAVIERQKGSPLTHTEQEFLLGYLHEYLGFPPDVIVMLAAYSIRIDCFHTRYVEKIALDWFEKGITDHDSAQEDIQRREQNRTFTGRIMRIFEMRRRPVAKQQAFIDEWQRKGYAVELIQFAYEKCRESADDKVSYPYINSILVRWAESGITTLSEAQADETAFRAEQKTKRKKKNGEAPAGKPGSGNSSIDMDEAERLMNAL